MSFFWLVYTLSFNLPIITPSYKPNSCCSCFCYNYYIHSTSHSKFYDSCGYSLPKSLYIKSQTNLKCYFQASLQTDRNILAGTNSPSKAEAGLPVILLSEIPVFTVHGEHGNTYVAPQIQTAPYHLLQITGLAAAF